MNILLVDDNRTIREQISLLLSRHLNAKCAIASNGEEGLQLFKREPPDLIIVDLNMPIMNGSEMVSAIRRVNQSIKIIAFSMMDDTYSKSAMMDAGCNSYVIKDGDPNALLDEIRAQTSL